MLGLEDAFARRGGRGQLDSIKVSWSRRRGYSLQVLWLHLIVSYA